MFKWFLSLAILTVTISSFGSKSNYCMINCYDTIPKGKEKADTVIKNVKIEKVVPDVKFENVELSNDSLVFIKVEIEPSVDSKIWVQHLQKYLPDYIEKAAKQNMPAGRYTVLVKFLVEKNGEVKDIQALNDPGYKLKEYAVKIVSTGPKWNPGIQNGKIVRAYHTQPITFVIEQNK